MQCIRALRIPAVTSLPFAPSSNAIHLARRSISILSLTRPAIHLPSPVTGLAREMPAPDLLPRISTHPSLAHIQLRNGPRDTFNPSHRVRKRRHGFLARLRTRNGRKILKRRQLKRRSTLSH